MQSMRKNFVDLIGQVFTRLTVVSRAFNTKQGSAQWVCRCEDGNLITVRAANLRNQRIKSCGCLLKEKLKQSQTRARLGGSASPGFKHGHSSKTYRTRTYQSWRSMTERCTSPNASNFARYGGANPAVLVCDRWLGKQGYKHFLADVGERPEGTTLGRFGDVGNYEPANC
jgi:hypothetical protein